MIFQIKHKENKMPIILVSVIFKRGIGEVFMLTSFESQYYPEFDEFKIQGDKFGSNYLRTCLNHVASFSISLKK